MRRVLGAVLFAAVLAIPSSVDAQLQTWCFSPLVEVCFSPFNFEDGVRPLTNGGSGHDFTVTGRWSLDGAEAWSSSLHWGVLVALSWSRPALFGIGGSFTGQDPITIARTSTASDPGVSFELATIDDVRAISLFDPATGRTIRCGVNGGLPAELGWEPIPDCGAVSSLAFDPIPLLTTVNKVPEPSTYLLMLSGLFGLGFVAWRRREETLA